MGKQPYRVLQVVTIMNRGGIETMIMNYYRAIDRTKIQFDFLVHRQERGDYDDEIESLGGRIFRSLPIRPWRYYQYFRWLDTFFYKHNKYIAIHSHIHENSGFIFKYASKYRINNLLCTSHIAIKHFDYKIIFRIYAKYYLDKYCTQRLACGNKAGKYLYGNKPYSVVKNAINTSEFVFNDSIRQQIRKDLNLDDCFVIGNIARFSPQKNHVFILKIFKELILQHEKSILVLVGTGETEKDIKNIALQLNVLEKVRFLGLRQDINNILQAFDVFLFPSLYEGLPVSIIEAQASGLPCILSNTIDPETAITDNVEFLSLDAPISQWVEIILSKMDFDRTDQSNKISLAGYDVTENSNYLCEHYIYKP